VKGNYGVTESSGSHGPVGVLRRTLSCCCSQFEAIGLALESAEWCHCRNLKPGSRQRAYGYMELRGAISRSANRSFDHVVAEIGFSTISTFSPGTSQATDTKLRCRKGPKRCPNPRQQPLVWIKNIGETENRYSPALKVSCVPNQPNDMLNKAWHMLKLDSKLFYLYSRRCDNLVSSTQNSVHNTTTSLIYQASQFYMIVWFLKV